MSGDGEGGHQADAAFTREYERTVDFEAFLDELRRRRAYRGQIVHVHREPPRPARYAAPARPLSAGCARLLAGMGIERLYLHQARALDGLRAGRDVLVTTGTASGKTLCYLLPIIERVESDPGARAIAVYPTKALAQDQCRVVQRARELAGVERLGVGVLDGDTPSSQRRRIRDEANLILTNPDMLHAAVLPQHPRWAGVLSRLSYVVVDELHTYTGLLGSNVANLFRRLDRLCRHYGSRPRFCCSSATLANPREVAEKLLERQVELIAEDGAPRGARTFVLWNPPRVRRRRWRSRRSANVEAQELMTALVRAGVPAITFSKAKVTAELICRYVRESLQHAAPDLAAKVAPYRGGYLAAERREIERELFSGELLGVSSTSALELGIDVGGLEASVICGYPGTLASFFQQGGRAGRREAPALVVLVGLDTAINQYVMRHPEYLFGRPIEEGVLLPDNAYVLLGHLRCAAHELPLGDDEVARFGPHAPVVLDVLESQHKLHHDTQRGRWHHSAPETPQHEVSLRDVVDKDVAIVDVSDGEKVIGQLNKLDAPPIIHPEAIYLHRGETYFVEELDLDRYICRVRPVEVDYYTQPLGGTDVHHIDHQLRERPFGAATLCFGEVTTHFRTWGYERVHFYSLDALSRHPLDLPTFQMETTAFWLVPPETLCQRLRDDGLDPHSGCRGIGYAARMVLPLFVRCQTLDFSHSVGAANAPWQSIFVYERYPLGLGFTERAYEIAGRLFPAVLDHIRTCECEDGCPCCVGKPLRQLVTWNVERGEGSVPSKKAAVRILEGVLGDGSRLDEPDTTSLGQMDAEKRLALERSLRRRLEHHREPLIPEPVHPIRQGIETGYPQPEERSTLRDADVARRAFRRKRFAKAARRGEPEPGPATPSPNVQEAVRRGTSQETDAARRVARAARARASGPETQRSPGDEQKPIAMGDDLAARARRARRGRKET
ncbi:MAG: DEAD/DEAH box helicase [Candidatus Brocadiia bacterium]